MIVAGLILMALAGIEEEALHLPTTVVVLEQGGAVVLDGANHRLAFFDDQGNLYGFAGRRGAGIGEFLDPLGMCRGPDRTIIVADTGNRRLQVLDQGGGGLREMAVAGRPTGVACDPDHGLLYVTDSRNHSVQVFTLEGTLVACHALEPGLFPAYPCSPLFYRGVLYVVEPLNGRIALLDPDGGAKGYIGSLVTGKGDLFSPRAVAVDDEGRLFVTDGFMDRVTVFSGAGQYLGEMEGFDTPHGAAFDARGRLLVVEMGSGTLKMSEAVWRPPHNEEGEGVELRACIACHPPGEPMEAAGRPAVCLRCHDGSVKDSRRGAFASHSHRQVSMDEDTCMTCHQAHGGDAFFEMDTAIYLRLPGLEGGVCRTCHQEPLRARGPAHPMGPLEQPLSQSLIRRGAAASGTLDCRTCHQPHGRGDRSLLLEGPVCLECHQDAAHENVLHIGLFTCLDCHRMHGGGEPSLVREKPGERDCSDCHEAQSAIRGTAHGTEDCTQCHAAFETGAQCASCHDTVPASHHHGEDLPLGNGVERVGCATCHDPHRRARGFLRENTVSTLCAACHGPEGLWLYLHSHSR
jgi:tripartite motif-containing protein 71